MRIIVWSATAIDQYDNAIDYLARQNQPAAARLAERIETAILALAKRPIGRPGERAGTFEKRILKTSYLLVYSLSGGPDGELRIHRIFHMSQNWRGWDFSQDEGQT